MRVQIQFIKVRLVIIVCAPQINKAFESAAHMRVIYEILLQLLVHPLLQFFFNDLLSNYLHVVSHFILSGNQLDGSNF